MLITHVNVWFLRKLKIECRVGLNNASGVYFFLFMKNACYFMTAVLVSFHSVSRCQVCRIVSIHKSLLWKLSHVNTQPETISLQLNTETMNIFLAR